MPKKTKKQKKQADNRHSSIAPVSLEQSEFSQTPLTSTFQFKLAKSPVAQARQIEALNELSAIRSDIVKTIVLAIIAFGIEIAFYIRWYK